MHLINLHLSPFHLFHLFFYLLSCKTGLPHKHTQLVIISIFVLFVLIMSLQSKTIFNRCHTKQNRHTVVSYRQDAVNGFIERTSASLEIKAEQRQQI